MNALLLSIVFQVVAKVAKFAEQNRGLTYEELVNGVLKEMGPDLPKTADGSDWTVEKLQAIAAGNEEILDRVDRLLK